MTDQPTAEPRHVDGLFAPDGPLPRHGPYDPDRLAVACHLLTEVARYLNYATRHPDSTPTPADVGRVWSGLRDTIDRLVDETLVRTACRLDQHAADRHAYVDDLPRLNATGAAQSPLLTAHEAIEALGAARASLDVAVRKLAEAASLANRIGLRDEDEENGRG